MSRTKRAEKTKHCNVVGCAKCEAERIEKVQNRAFKVKKAKGIK